MIWGGQVTIVLFVTTVKPAGIAGPVFFWQVLLNPIDKHTSEPERTCAQRPTLASYSISSAHGARMFQASEQRERFIGNEPVGSSGSRGLTPCYF